MKRKYILLTLIVLALWSAGPAFACWPYVIGQAEKNGVPAANMLVDIELDGQPPFCGPATFTDYTDANGEFSYCVGCAGTVTITIEDESRTQAVNGLTDFGVWQVLGTPGDNDRDGLVDAEEELLLATYAPQVRLHSDDWTRPANVPWHLARSYMRYTHRGCSDCEILPRGLVTTASITERCHQNKSGWPWCNHEGSCNPSDSYVSSDHKVGFFLQQHNEDHSGSGNTGDWIVYGHVYPKNGDGVVVQYWFFYPYNDSVASVNHEGDWEYVAVTLNASGSISNLTYSQHNGNSVFMPWDVQWVENTHPVVYAAKGSHANYRAASGGDCVDAPTYDNCNDGGTWWNTWDTQQFGGVTWVGEKYRNYNDSNWLRYSGRWGEIGEFEGTSGPRGPAYQWTSWTVWGAYEECDNGADDDVDGQIDETDCVDAPDFRINEVNPAVAPNGDALDIVVPAAGSFPARLTLQNTGGGYSGPIPVELRLSEDTEVSADDLLLPGCCEFAGIWGYSTLGPLPTQEVFLPPGLQAGSYWMTAVADPEGLINEGISGEDDNEAVSIRRVRVVDDAILLENFDDGVADGFLPQLGSWSAASGSYQGVAPDDDHNDSASVIAVATESVTMEFDAKVAGGGGVYYPYFGAMLRFVDEFHHLRVDFYHSGTDRVRLLGWAGGDMGDYIRFAEVDLATNLASGWHHFRIEDTGCDVSVYVDGNLVLQSSYSLDVPHGQRGFFVNYGDSVAFDNLLITELDSDGDNDGYDYCDDCNDSNPDVSPGDSERCDTPYDDDCDGQVNEGCGGGSPIFRKPPIKVDDPGIG
jgi:hypothetical protein